MSRIQFLWGDNMARGKKIKIIIGNEEISGELMETQTAENVYKALPLESEVNRWGDEVYFFVPVEAELESGATDIQEIGNICFWTPGKAIAIFFGPTPASRGNEPRAYEPVNLFGKISEGLNILKIIKSGEKVRMERVE